MIIPVRCFSCGKPIGHLWEEYKERVQKGEDPKKVMDSLGLERYCCRSTLLGHVDLIDTAAKFKKVVNLAWAPKNSIF
jgi:DNA-directed RNA polymerase subunit N